MRDDERKLYPVWSGVLMYFPDALRAVSEVSRLGSQQHNPGEPMYWSRDKSPDQMNAAVRHLLDHGQGHRYDMDGGRHLAKAAWRILAELQCDIEQHPWVRMPESVPTLHGTPPSPGTPPNHPTPTDCVDPPPPHGESSPRGAADRPVLARSLRRR